MYFKSNFSATLSAVDFLRISALLNIVKFLLKSLRSNANHKVLIQKLTFTMCQTSNVCLIGGRPVIMSCALMSLKKQKM
jgi:hypothetical protein